jgi:hypothetical protein
MIRSLVLAGALLSLADVAAAQAPQPASPETPTAAGQPGSPTAAGQPGSPAAPAAPAPAAGQPRRANGESTEITWLGGGAMFTSGDTQYASTLGAALRPSPSSGLAVMLEWTASWYGDPVSDVYRAGLAWFGSKVPLAPFVGAHYALFYVDPDHASAEWSSGIGGRLGIIPWRQKKEEGHRFGLSKFVTYDHAFSCSRSCDVLVPQAALTWEPYF